MKKDLVFFGENGLTSTSANHICNLAKEWLKVKENEVKNNSFVSVSVSLIGQSPTVIQSEQTSEELDMIPLTLEEIVEIQSLIAWLREAIKAREALLNEVNNTEVEDYIEQNNLIPIEYPESPRYLTNDEWLASRTIKERELYYSLETKCAVLGKYIHPNGELSKKRNELLKINKNPHKVVGEGRDAMVYSYSSLISIEKMDKLFFELQKQYREAQAQLNSIKFEMEKAITEDGVQKSAKYAELQSNYYNQKKELESQLAAWKKEEAKRISSLKIVIPVHLQRAFDYVSKLGK